jgi:hypothetical protein
MTKEIPELLVTVTFRIPAAKRDVIMEKVAPIMQMAMNTGGETAHLDIEFYEEEVDGSRTD